MELVPVKSVRELVPVNSPSVLEPVYRTNACAIVEAMPWDCGQYLGAKKRAAKNLRGNTVAILVSSAHIRTMKSHDIEIGQRFGAWLVIGAAVRVKIGNGRSANYPLLYPCRCDCGTLRNVRAFKLLGNSRSCGCLTSFIKSSHIRHGHASHQQHTRLYRIWGAMLQRCSNQKNSGYASYGGRGISVCSEWRDFAVFAAWALKNGYADNLQIDRKNNDDGYAPDNCRWLTDAQNKRNKRANMMIEAFGETKCVTDWALDSRCTVTPSNIRHRIKDLGMSNETAITTPRRTQKSSGRFIGHHVPK